VPTLNTAYLISQTEKSDLMYSFFTSALTMSLMLLPAGVVAGIPVKTVLFIIATLVTAERAFHKKIIVPKIVFYLFIPFISAFFIMTLTGLIYGNSYALTEFKFLATATATTCIVSIFARNNLYLFVRLILHSTIIYAAFKLLLLLSTSLIGLSITEIDIIYRQIFGEKFVYMPINDALYRIQLPPDIIYAVIPALYVMLCKTSRTDVNWKTLLLLFISSSVITFSAYSRVVFFLYFISSSIAFYLQYRSKKWIYIAVSSFIITILTLNLDLIVESNYLEERLSDRNNEASDSVRKLQISLLMDMWLEKPMTGHGLGAYIPNFVRNPAIPFSYEAQVIALIMKGGLFFIFCFLISISYFVKNLLITSGILATLLFSLLIAAGFTNPYLTSTATTVIYAGFYILGSTRSQKLIFHKQIKFQY